MPGLVVAMAPASTQDGEDVNGESGYRAAESSLLHTHLPPCLKIPSFICMNVYTFRRLDVAPSEQRWERASKPRRMAALQSAHASSWPGIPGYCCVPPWLNKS